MVDMRDLRGERIATEQGVVAGGDGAAACVAGVEIGELNAQDRGLYFVEPGIHAGAFADVSVAPAVFAQGAGGFGQFRIIGDESAPVAEGAEILSGVEAER